MISCGLIGTPLKDDLESINSLMQQLSPGTKLLTEEGVYNIFNQPNLTLIVARDKVQIVGMVSLVAISTLKGKRGCIHDLVVDQKYRGQGIGAGLIQKALSFANSKSLEFLDLTSMSHRQEANKLYLRFGFKLMGKVGEDENSQRNYYRKKL